MMEKAVGGEGNAEDEMGSEGTGRACFGRKLEEISPHYLGKRR